MSAGYAPAPFEEDLIGCTSPQAVLALTMPTLAARLGLEVASGCDDLDYYEAAAVSAAGEVVLLMAHRGNPGKRAQVYLRDAPGYLQGAAGGEEDARRRVDAVLAALGLVEAYVDWRRGELDPGMDYWRDPAHAPA